MKTFITAIVAILVIWGLYKVMKNNAMNTPATATSTIESVTASSTEDMSVENYVRTNISSLSPTKEQLGGTYYVTAFSAQNGTGTVSFEDGHNAYTADFTYMMSATGTPIIKSFKLR